MKVKQYISYQIAEPDVDRQEMIIAELQDFGFDGFEQTDITITANGPAENIDAVATEAFLQSQKLPFSVKTIDEQNWNAQWEQSFDPIIVNDFCAVRASFHQPVQGVRHEIIITPKMSFGTGHHATTYMMLGAMEHIAFENKTVIDFGSGTGILAILAEKLGAATVQAIDYDDWCIENGRENIEANNCNQIQLRKADNLDGAEPADVLLANINKHVILQNLPAMRQKLKVGGILLVSGFLDEDEADIMYAAVESEFWFMFGMMEGGWLAMCFGVNAEED